MLTYADVCWRMLTNAGVGGASSLRAKAYAGASSYSYVFVCRIAWCYMIYVSSYCCYIYVSAYCFVFVLILLYVSSYCYVCVLILLHVCVLIPLIFNASTYVSAYYLLAYADVR